MGKRGEPDGGDEPDPGHAEIGPKDGPRDGERDPGNGSVDGVRPPAPETAGGGAAMENAAPVETEGGGLEEGAPAPADAGDRDTWF